MIEIQCSDNRLSVKGHAGYGTAGQDIYCAAVSTLINTFINAYDVHVITYAPGLCEVEWEDANTYFLTEGLKLLALQHPEYIKYKEVKTGG